MNRPSRALPQIAIPLALGLLLFCLAKLQDQSRFSESTCSRAYSASCDKPLGP
jgi:hypothetical protein